MPPCSWEDHTRSFGDTGSAAVLRTDPRDSLLSCSELGVLNPEDEEAKSEHRPGLDGSYGTSGLVLWRPERPWLVR